MKLRKERRQKLDDSLDEQRKDEEGDYIPRDFADWRKIPSEALQKKELRQALFRALASLTPKHREVFVLRDVQHFSIAETAQMLGIRHKCGENAPLACPPSDARRACTGYRWELEHRPQ